MGLGPCFDVRFSSHLIGHLKPDKEAFEFVVAALGCAPERILFLDDNRLNIDGALAVGMQARRTMDYRRCSPHWRNSASLFPPSGLT